MGRTTLSFETHFMAFISVVSDRRIALDYINPRVCVCVTGAEIRIDKILHLCLLALQTWRRLHDGISCSVITFYMQLLEQFIVLNTLYSTARTSLLLPY